MDADNATCSECGCPYHTRYHNRIATLESERLALLDGIATERRAALEEAARLVCAECVITGKQKGRFFGADGDWHHPTLTGDGKSVRCLASPIWRALSDGGPRGTT